MLKWDFVRRQCSLAHTKKSNEKKYTAKKIVQRKRRKQSVRVEAKWNETSRWMSATIGVRRWAKTINSTRFVCYTSGTPPLSTERHRSSTRTHFIRFLSSSIFFLFFFFASLAWQNETKIYIRQVYAYMWAHACAFHSNWNLLTFIQFSAFFFLSA